MLNFSFSSPDDKINAHLQNYRRALSQNKPVNISEFVRTYLDMKPLLHLNCLSSEVDFPALSYAVNRLPPFSFRLKNIYIGQNSTDFDRLCVDRSNRQIITAKSRRRLMYVDQVQENLCCQINSESDIDDLVNLFLIYQIELKKIKNQLATVKDKIKTIFEKDSQELIDELPNIDFDPKIMMFPMSDEIFWLNCHQWWQSQSAKSLFLNLDQCPVYFVSSNSHSLVNIIGGFINQKQNYLFDYIAHHHQDIYNQWFESKVEHNFYQVNDFLYYLSSEFLKDNFEFVRQKEDYERNLGVIELKYESEFPTNVQIIPVKALSRSPNLDSNLKIAKKDLLSQSPAIIVNVQYPLGIAAKYLLAEMISYFPKLKSVYILGKAAILDGAIGDIQIPEIIIDEINNNNFKIDNIFNSFFPFANNISKILTFQKAVCVYGTLLESQKQIENYRQTKFNIIEMESSHYLSAIAQHYLENGKPLSKNSYYTIKDLPIDLGIINYASDNPIVQNLAHESLNFQSIETTYLPSLAILQRIIDLESKSNYS